MADRLATLRDVRRKLAAGLTTISKRIKLEKRRAASKERAWLLEQQHKDIVLTLYQLSDFACDAVVPYLDRIRAERHWPRRGDEELCDMVVAVFMEQELEYMLALLDVESISDVSAYAMAYEYSIQWRVAAWTEQQNLTKGIAPPTAHVLDKLEKARSAAPVGVPLFRWGTIDDKGSRRRASKLRERFG